MARRMLNIRARSHRGLEFHPREVLRNQEFLPPYGFSLFGSILEEF